MIDKADREAFLARAETLQAKTAKMKREYVARIWNTFHEKAEESKIYRTKRAALKWLAARARSDDVVVEKRLSPNLVALQIEV